jgi:hypothetical protein
MNGGLVGQSTPGGMSGSPPMRHPPMGAFAPASLGPGTRMMQRVANCASLSAHSPNPATRSALSNSEVFDHIIVSVIVFVRQAFPGLTFRRYLTHQE